jgi:hypothetical protein
MKDELLVRHLRAVAVVEQDVQSQHRRPRLTPFIDAGPGEAVQEDDPRVPAAEDREPRRQVSAEDLVFGLGVKLELPDGLLLASPCRPERALANGSS